MSKRATITHIQSLKEQGRKIAMLTAYDYATASYLEAAGIDAILVGDSCANVIAGQETTISMRLPEMRYHVRIVSRALTDTLLIADVPFLSIRSGSDLTLRHSGLLLQAGAHAVKLEGAGEMIAVTRRLVDLGIPVMGHLGLTPQKVRQDGGYRMHGKSEGEAAQILADALALEEAGAFSLVLEMIPDQVGRTVTAALKIPTIGIGAGPQCDGQILVVNDLLGLTAGRVPKFVRQYADIGRSMSEAFTAYITDVKEHGFPQEPDTGSSH